MRLFTRPCRHVARICACLLVAALPGAAGDEVSTEYQVKAAFLYNFTKFVDWPETAFAGAGDAIVIGVLGDNPFGDELENTVRHHTAKGRRLKVRRVALSQDAGRVHLLFVPRGWEEAFEALDPCQLGGVLTVGESKRFAALDGIVTFVTENDRVRFAINVDSAEQAGLRISAQLQKLSIGAHRKSRKAAQ